MRETREQRDAKYRKGLGMIDVYQAISTYEIAYSRFLEGALDTVTFLQAAECCESLYRWGCRDAGWSNNWKEIIERTRTRETK